MLIEQVPKCCVEYFEIAWLIMSRTSLKNRSSRSVGWQHFPELQNSLKNSSEKCLEQQVKFLQDVWLNQQESLFCCGFYFIRFLLICQLESLDLTFTLKWFFSLKNFRILSHNTSDNRVFKVLSSQNCKTDFSRFLPWFLG